MQLLTILLAIALWTTGVIASTSKRYQTVQPNLNCWGTNVSACQDPIVGSNGAVEVGTCSEIGVDILKQGGMLQMVLSSFYGPIIASGLCVGVISAYHSGLGGGGFMLVRFNNPNGTHGYETIDFRETMPAAGNVTLYSAYGVNQTKSLVGGLAVGVPGELRGWGKLHERHGSMPWKDLFQPAIDLARNGFFVNPDLAKELQDGPFIVEDPLFAETYAPKGTVLKLGDTCFREKYANTLENVSTHGADVFYANSTIASNTIAKIQQTGGIMTAEDLAGYEAIVRKPGMIEYRGQKIFSTSAPSSGTVTLSALKIFEGFDGSASDTASAINITTHNIIESTKFAYGQRANLADPAFVANATALEFSYLSEEVATEARAKISEQNTFTAAYYDPSSYYPGAESGTSHMAVVDSSGMAVSLTTTVNLLWGSRVVTEDGIILNDEMDDFGSPGRPNAFGFAPSPANFIAGGKRPLSSISSTIVENEQGQIVMATGSAGGSQIITATVQEVYHYIDQGLNATMCTRHPRWHDQLGQSTTFEVTNHTLGIQGYDNRTVAFLESLGHNVTYVQPGGSVSHIIGRLDNGDLLAGSDPRRISGYGAAY